MHESIVVSWRHEYTQWVVTDGYHVIGRYSTFEMAFSNAIGVRELSLDPLLVEVRGESGNTLFRVGGKHVFEIAC